MLEVGTKVLDFTLTDDTGMSWNLNDHLGKKMVLYFYPKDETPGCTTQACEFRDSFHQFESIDVSVVGISSDSVASHQAFKEHHQLPFTLLSDTDRDLISYFTGIKKGPVGNVKMAMARATFVLDEQGVIVQVYPKATPVSNAQEIVEFFKK